MTPRLTDRELTKGFGGSWPRHFFGPHEGRLDATQLVIRAELLARHSPASDAFFRYWWLATDDWGGGHDQAFQGRILDVATLHDEPHLMRCTPTHWFPADHAWCVASDYDCTMTLVGGSRALIADLLAHPAIEALRIGRDKLLDAPDAAG